MGKRWPISVSQATGTRPAYPECRWPTDIRRLRSSRGCAERDQRKRIPLWHALDSMEDARGLLRGHDMSSRVGRSPARPLESSTGMGRATLGTWIGQRSLPARGAPFGAVVSLVAVSQVTVRRARAERREAARLAVAAAVRPLQLELARYTYAAGQRTSSKRDNEAAHMDDHQHVVVGVRVSCRSRRRSGTRRHGARKA